MVGGGGELGRVGASMRLVLLGGVYVTRGCSTWMKRRTQQNDRLKLYASNETTTLSEFERYSCSYSIWLGRLIDASGEGYGAWT